MCRTEVLHNSTFYAMQEDDSSEQIDMLCSEIAALNQNDDRDAENWGNTQVDFRISY